jgi:hypothetical protein
MESINSGANCWVEGTKSGDELPFYAFGWRSQLSGEQAGELFDNAPAALGLKTEDGYGTLEILLPEGAETYEWAPSVAEGEETDLADLKLAEARAIILSVDDSALYWNTYGGERGTEIAVVTNHRIGSLWIQRLFDRTVEHPTRQLVSRNIGTLTAGIVTFLEQPFGECTIDQPFRQQA